MKQHEAVIKVMEENGGLATLGFLYQAVMKIKDCEWKTKTPFASVRRIVQDERFFFKIRPSLWALKTYKNKLPFVPGKVSESEQKEFNHAYYQGLLVEIGNLKRHDTFVPYQDKNKNYLGRKLRDLTTVNEYYEFTYGHIIKKARTVDVTWFNERKMPKSLFEVEHSTDFQNSLLKFMELQDFNSDFFIVADALRKREYDSRISMNAFSVIHKRVKFMSYDKLAVWHEKTFELSDVEAHLSL